MAGEPRIFERKMTPEELAQLAADTFEDMIKLVADVQDRLVAAGGMMHADGEALLLERGSRQSDLWGANYFIGRPAGKRLEYTALINIRSGDMNPDQEIQSAEIREKVRKIVERLVGPA